MKKYNIIDLFAGCGGLLDGFLQTGLYCPIASVEWELPQVETLRNRLKTKYNINDADKSVIRFDIQRTDELINGFNDSEYGESCGLKKIIRDREIDFVIGGPPCQAYSVAGRIRANDRMHNDYRNYLFEYYLKIVEYVNPKLFVFENVPGMLSAMPDGTPIIDLIRSGFKNIGFEIVEDIRNYALVNAHDYGVPQNRKRIILIGINKKYFSGNIQEILKDFYQDILPTYKEDGGTVGTAIGDLEKIYPTLSSTSPSHILTRECSISWHIPRFHAIRDVKIFKMLCEDIESGKNEFHDSNVLRDIYNQATGSETKVHKYHVLKKDEPSTTILAHLHKDGLRFIHYDSTQARSITVREAARLQSFDDDFNFIGSQGNAYKMIGNAVPPVLSKKIALAINDLIKKYREEL